MESNLYSAYEFRDNISTEKSHSSLRGKNKVSRSNVY